MKSARINERDLRDINASVYMVSNGIRRQKETIKWQARMFTVQTFIALTLGVLGAISYHNYTVANSHLKQTQDQLRQESGKAADFERWYNKNCVQTYKEDICRGA